MAARNGYSILQIGLHWAIALLILITWFLGDGMGRALAQRIREGQTGFEGNTIHVWLGAAVFVLVLIRIIVRLVSGAPASLKTDSVLMEKLASWGHKLLYVLMVLVPALGAITWYGKIELFGDVHEIASNLLMLTALGHALAALYHHAMLKDGTLMRMLRPEGNR